MINPFEITNYQRTDDELEEFILFAALVAGKRAVQQSKKLDAFLRPRKKSPFHYLRRLLKQNLLLSRMQEFRLGQYSRLLPCFTQLATRDLDLRNCQIFHLAEIHGIAFKTASFFLLQSREGYKFPCIDTHALKHLRSRKYAVPVSVPSTWKRYSAIARMYSELHQREAPHMTLAEYDLMIWKRYTKTKAQDLAL